MITITDGNHKILMNFRCIVSYPQIVLFVHVLLVSIILAHCVAVAIDTIQSSPCGDIDVCVCHLFTPTVFMALSSSKL
jgi:hypothetical protein